MIIKPAQLTALFTAFNAIFNKGFKEAPSHYGAVSMTVPSNTAEETYSWLGQLPRMREWLGDRVIKSIAAHGFTVKNKRFESTIEVARTDIEDDRLGTYSPLFQDLGRAAGEHPDELIFNLLGAGFTTTCYDGQYFFDTDHPVQDKDGNDAVASNMTAGAGPAWYLLDTSRAVRPLIYQERLPNTLSRMDQDENPHVFLRDKYIYGTRGRSNAGFGLWQLAYGSKATLTKDHYRDARAAMTSLRGDEGRPLGVRPDTLVVPPELEEAGLAIVNAATGDAGASNVWAGTSKLIVTPWLAP